MAGQATALRAPRSSEHNPAQPRSSVFLRTVFLKSLRDQAKSILGWGLGLGGLAWLTLLFYPEVAKMGSSFDDMLKSMPALAGFLGDVATFTTIGGYVVSQLLSYMPMVLAIYAVLAATSTITGEIESGTIDTLLSQPVPRWRVILEKYAAIVVSILAICVLFSAGMWIGALSVGQDVPVSTWLLAGLSVFPLTLFYGSIAFALACALRGRGIPLGVSVGLAVTGFILNGLAPLVESLNAHRELTIYYLFTANKPFTTGLDWAYTSILLGGCVVLLAVAVVAFERRDITG